MDSDEETIIRLLTDATNRAVLTALNDAAKDLSVTELADHILLGSSITGQTSDYEAEVERLLLRLHHDHLPRLDEAGLIEYDRDEQVVAYGDYTGVDAEWADIAVLDELLSRFRAGETFDEEAIGLLEDSDAVYDYSRQIADEAENELFLIYASDDLLDEACLPHAKNAIERGVTLYAGTTNPDAREFFRENLPEATIWEPQLDWMYQTSTYPKISRMIFADRETVVVGLWIDDGHSPREVAMIGDGSTNPLVTMIRELLGSRLDHLDYQSEDLLEQFSFNHD